MTARNKLIFGFIHRVRPDRNEKKHVLPSESEQSRCVRVTDTVCFNKCVAIAQFIAREQWLNWQRYQQISLGPRSFWPYRFFVTGIITPFLVPFVSTRVHSVVPIWGRAHVGILKSLTPHFQFAKFYCTLLCIFCTLSPLSGFGIKIDQVARLCHRIIHHIYVSLVLTWFSSTGAF